MDEMQNSSNQAPVGEPYKLQGIGGWLILVAISLVVTPITLLFTVINILPSYTPTIWKLITTQGSQVYHSLMAPLMIFELGINIFLLLFSIVLLVIFFTKKKSFPRLFIIFLAVQLIALIIDYVGIRAIPVLSGQQSAGLRMAINAAIRCAIWIPYTILSVRVRNTFVE